MVNENTQRLIKELNRLNPTKIDTSKASAVAKTLPKTSGAIGWIPYVGDVADIGMGITNIATGHPFVGMGQLGLGTFGLATGGIGSKLAKAGGKGIGALANRAVQYSIAHPYKTRLLPGIGLNLFASEDDVKKENNNTNGVPKELPMGMDTFDVLTDKKYNPPKIESVDIEKAKSAQVKPTVTNMIPSGNQQVDQVQPGISELLANYGVALQQGHAPYLEALQAYVNNYNRNIEDSDRRRRYYTALAGLSGNQGYLNLANVNDPRQVELDRINTINALQNARMGNIDKLYQAIGNEAIAQQIGLPEGSGFANKDLLSAFTGQQKSLLGLQGKMYGADMGYNARVFDSVMDSETQKAIAQGRIDVALQLQAMKNDASYRNALVNASGFGATPQNVQAMLQQFGYQPAIGLNREGIALTQSGVEDFSNELKGNR